MSVGRSSCLPILGWFAFSLKIVGACRVACDCLTIFTGSTNTQLHSPGALQVRADLKPCCKRIHTS